MGSCVLCIYCAIVLVILHTEVIPTVGLLYPQMSETREVRSLNDLWNFIKSNEISEGVDKKWFLNDLSRVGQTIPMPVPSSYNDITTEHEFRDHVGTVWYDRKFFAPKSWALQQRVWLRFGSVHYDAIVYINGNMVVQHEFGHLPFEAEITSFLKYGKENRITVMCSNMLEPTTVPQGQILFGIKDGFYNLVQNYTFDSFNYAGIQRSVHLYTTPLTYIKDIVVHTTLENYSTGIVTFRVETNSSTPLNEALYVRIQLRNKKGIIVANKTSHQELHDFLEVKNVTHWWPYLMHTTAGYLYQMEVFLYDSKNMLHDVYRLPVGIRSLNWNSNILMINNRPIYFRGIARHEDSDIHGNGLDLPLMTRDFNLLKWIGANACRTTHYPYSEESMQFADENGIMIINECPSINTDVQNFPKLVLLKHKSAMKQLIHRDRNHPSVVMWSIASEPHTEQKIAGSYFKNIVEYSRGLDGSRPFTAAIAVASEYDKAAKYLDIISFNRYNGWHNNPGHLDLITKNVIDEATAWFQKHNKLVIMSEYGAGTFEGLHLLPSNVWSEEYQLQLFSQHFKAFDILRKNPWFIGEFVGNFADYKTAQSITRVGGNKKGIFTRSRQPKAVAYLLRKRYFSLCRKIKQCNMPDDIVTYIKDYSSERTGKQDRTDL